MLGIRELSRAASRSAGCAKPSLARAAAFEDGFESTRRVWLEDNVLEGYEIECELYRGRRRVVWRAVRVDDGSRHIIKSFLVDVATDEDVAAIRHEFDVLSHLTADGVPRVRGLLSDGSGFHLILEDKGGSTLAEYARTVPRDVVARLDVAISMAVVLEQVHLERVAHLDINPANVLVDESYGVTLIDFGLSTRQAEEYQPLTHPGRLRGTLPYISPEQTGRMNRPVDYRSDFYSLGVTLFELFSGRLPFQSDDPMALIYSHLAVPAPALAAVCGDVPASISAVVAKLLEKAPEDRYQTAQGLLSDLRACRSAPDSELAAFEPGRGDVGDRFLIARRLYGRASETRDLLDCFAQASAGGVGLVLVAGHAGAGKSALVQSLQTPVTERRGYFVAGKFDQLQLGVPYSALAAAVGELVAQILTEPEDALHAWSNRLRSALGANGQLVVDLVPEIEHIIGAQPPVPTQTVTQSRNRFRLVFGNLLRAFCDIDHPLVLFLDDLQWADPASLGLLETVLTDIDSHHLLVIGAYRDSEVDASHPLAGLVTAANSEPRVTVTEFVVGALDASSVARLLEDTLHATDADLDGLQALVLAKTAGNPFFLRQFLTMLHRKQKVAFDHIRRRWTWSVDEIEAMHFTTNVIDLMVARLEELPRSTLETIQLASCIGGRFDLGTLALIAGEHRDGARDLIRPALDAGLVIPDREGSLTEPGDTANGRGRFRFLHDRVQQAAHAMLDETTRIAAHLQIGQRLRASIPDLAGSDRLFEIVEHLNAGVELLTDDVSRGDLAALNLVAARRALAATAPVAADVYATKGLSCLPADPWSSYELTRDLLRARVDAAFLRGDFESSQRTITEMLTRLRSPAEEAELLIVLVMQQTLSGNYREGIDTSRRTLASLGIAIPDGDLGMSRQTALQTYQELRAGRAIASFITLPQAESAEVTVAMRLLARLCPLCYIADPPLCQLAATLMVNLSLMHGHTSDSSLGYAFFGLLQSAELHAHEDAEHFGALAMALAEQQADAAHVCKVAHMVCAFITPWRRHLREFDAVNRRGFNAGLQSGELQYAGYHQYNRALCLFHLGTNLNALVPELEELMRFGTRTRNQHATDPIVATIRVIQDLSGVQVADNSGDSDEAAFLEDLAARNARPALCHYHVLRTQVLFLHRRLEQAEQLAGVVEVELPYVSGHIAVAVQTFYASLIAASLAAAGTGDAAERIERARQGGRRLREWADSCPANFQHKALLVEAEVAGLDGDAWRAADLYDRAIVEAGRSGYLQEEALARELAGRFWLGQGRRKVAALYLSEAHHGYRLWGASRKATMLEEEYRGLIAGTPVAHPSHEATSIPFFTLVSSTGAALDFATVMKAARTISKEVALDSLVTQLVKIAVEAAGAQRGYLLRRESGRFLAVASSTFDGGETSYQSAQSPADVGIPSTIVNYVGRTRTTLTISDVEEDARFNGDEVVRRTRPRSVLCVPITNRGDTASILYLEHGTASGAFTQDRVEILQSLAAQAAVSLENATLYQAQERTAGELRLALSELQRLKTQLEAENLYLQEEIQLAHGDIVGGSAAIMKVLKAVETVAGTDVTVVVTGETGTGKELVARAIHTASPRRHKPLIKVNCASIPKDLFESEFFGHVRGAFTGALRDRTGRFELADKGTLFLDEVGDLPLDMQSKLLRVLQEGEFERVGDERTRKVDVRVLAATNRDLKEEVRAGRFRQDLYYRLSVFPIDVAPLRERREDIPHLAAHCLRLASERLKLPLPTLTAGNVAKLQAHNWPGNVRELQNIIERALIVSGGGSLRLDLPMVEVSGADPGSEPLSSASSDVIAENEKLTRERDNVRAALRQSHWKVSGVGGAAELLGIKASTLASRIKKLGLTRVEPH